jgi:hypothetical protein
MNGNRFAGLLLILVCVALLMTPYYGYERATWHVLVAIVAAVAGATLLFRGRQVNA